LSEGDGVAVRILLDFADPESIRAEVLNVLSGSGSGAGPFVPKSPPLAPEVGAEIERVRADKEEAIDKQEFDRAAELRDRERRLVRAAYELERAWSGEPSPDLEVRPIRGTMPMRVSDQDEPRPAFRFPVGWLLFAVPLGVGILIGWAIWG
jgi:hypothetical protein